MIVIHIRDFEPEDDDKNKHLKVGVYKDIIEKYYGRGKPVWVVCQPESVQTPIVQDLVHEFGAVVHTGQDAIDAQCILTRARILIPTTSSSFSQISPFIGSPDMEVHYLTHTLDEPMVTLKVPGWKYHLTNKQVDAIQEFDVDHDLLHVIQA